MHHYQLVSDNTDMEPGDTPSAAPPTPPLTSAIATGVNEKDVESQLPPKYEDYRQLHSEDDSPPSPTTPSSTLLPTQSLSLQQTALRKPWIILSLPIAIAILISTSVFICLSSSSSLTYVSPTYPSAIEQQQLQEDQKCGEADASKFPFRLGDGGGVLSSSSWPRIPSSPVTVSVSDNSVAAVVSEEVHQAVVVAQANKTGMNGNVIVVNGEILSTEMGLDGIEIISVDPAREVVETVVVAVEIEVEAEAEQANEDLREFDDEEDEDEDDDDDDDWDEEDDDEDDDWDDEDDEEDWDEEEDDEEGGEEDERVEGQAAAALVEPIDPPTTATAIMLDEVSALKAELIGQVMIPVAIDNTLDGMNLDLSEDGVGTGDTDSVVLLSLRRNDNNETEEEEEKEEDEDEQDHFPTNIGNDDDGDEEGDEEDEDEQLDEKPNRKGGKNRDNNGGSSNNNINGGGNKDNSADENKNNDNNNNNSNKHKHKHQDQNANLGGTGGNGPILLCSSKSCLPSLRDFILSKLSIQVHQVMDHLRSRHTLVHMMSSTAPQTKESLMAGQEELVQQLEDRVIKDLRDWVNGVGRKSKPGGNKKATIAVGGGAGTHIDGVGNAAVMPEHGTFPLLMDGQSISSNQEVTVEMEGLFLDSDDFEEEEDESEEGFHMASLSFEDADDDDEDHEDDTFAKASVTVANSTKKKPSKSIKKGIKLHRRDASPLPSSPSSGATAGTAAAPPQPSPREYFLSADKLLMRQEWSRWIAHWVHHTKLLILSHTLATHSLVEMNKVAVSGENVVPVDQRHWSWNLDKALATVMVASEMICGAPSSAKDVKVFLSTLSSASTVAATGMGASGSDGSLDMMSPKALAITLNAQRCIESWSDELEEILQRTATTA